MQRSVHEHSDKGIDVSFSGDSGTFDVATCCEALATCDTFASAVLTFMKVQIARQHPHAPLAPTGLPARMMEQSSKRGHWCVLL